MANIYLIGVDIGTQGTKAALYSGDGVCVANSFEQSCLLHPTPDATIQEPTDILKSVFRTIKDVVEKSGVSPSDIASIGIDAQMAGIIGINSNAEAVTPYDSWLDSRCMPYVQKMKQTAEEKIIKTTGGQVTVAHGAKILWWKHEQPEIYKNIDKFVTPTAYVVLKLCGLKSDSAYIDTTHLHFTGFADTLNCCWSDELLSIFNVEKSKMPRIVKPYEAIGKLSEKCAELCGLVGSIPIVAGCGDSAASSLGAGITRPGLIYDIAGTASVFSCSTNKFTPDAKNKTILFMRSAIDDLWIPLAYISGGGLCLKWFSDISSKSLSELDDLSVLLPPVEDLIFIPHFSGRTCPNDSKIKGAFIGLDWSHTNAHMYRSIMESVAFEYDSYFNILRTLDPSLVPSAVYGVGGGSKSTVFNQIKADVLGVDYYPLECGDTATFGSAALAGYGCGIFENLSDIVETNKKTHPKTSPNYENTITYENISLKYRKYLAKFADLF